jgi:hypothetical protein
MAKVVSLICHLTDTSTGKLLEIDASYSSKNAVNYLTLQQSQVVQLDSVGAACLHK